jgi:leader peptidase (prepilin peptidase)/N-methyltransferase
VQFVALGLVGIVLGALANAAIYSLAWFSRPISPWQRRHPDAPTRRGADYLPIIGWFGLARESGIHGRGFWIRPLVIELACAIGLPALYVFEKGGGLTRLLPVPGLMAPATTMHVHHFVAHASLFWLMLVATFIDFDEKTIPDAITVPGTLLGLVIMTVWTDALLPVVHMVLPPRYDSLLFTTAIKPPAWLDGPRGGAIAVALFVAWCIALIPALCTLRRGWPKAVQFYFASAGRHSAWWKMLLLAAMGSATILFVWRRDGAAWHSLFSSLVGLAFGGGMIWAVRIAGRIGLRKEAMGFGDVTLMAMIGAYIGWQAALMVFFLSPFAALVIALAQWAITGRRDIPSGPYLCASTVVVVMKWPWFWTQFGPLFEVGLLLPAVLTVCLALMVLMLMGWRLAEDCFFRSRGT